MSNANGRQLPTGWASATLQEIGAINPRLDGRVFHDDLDVAFVPMAAVDVEHGGVNRPETRSYSSVKKGYTPFFPGDVIVAKITPCMENGKVAVVPELVGDVGFGSTEFHVIRPSTGIDARWISHFLWQSSVRHSAWRAMTGGVGQLRVPKKFLQVLSLPITGTAEQCRILEKIEELLSDLDAGVAALERVKRNLKRFRASVLKAAVEGKLTEAWRAEHPDGEPASELLARILKERRRNWEADQLATYKAKGKTPPRDWKQKYKEPVLPESSGLARLPDRWCWATLDQLGRLDRGRSRHRPRNAAHLYGGPHPFIQTGDVRAADQYIRSHKQTYSELGLAQSRLWPEETLCITIAANIAETAILSYQACFPDSVVGVVFDDELVSVRYMEMFIRTVRDRIEAYAPATAQKNINNEVLRNLCVALPPRQEQAEIVAEVESRLSVAAFAERTIASGMMRSTRLRQCILKRAFEGKLVPQDPNDEPASVLLNRIRADRAANGVRPRKKTVGPRRRGRSKSRG